MIRLLVLAAALRLIWIHDQQDCMVVLNFAAHWIHRIIFEAIPVTIILTAFCVPWLMLFLAIKRNGTLGTVAATMALAILSNVLIGHVLIVFDL